MEQEWHTGDEFGSCARRLLGKRAVGWMLADNLSPQAVPRPTDGAQSAIPLVSEQRFRGESYFIAQVAWALDYLLDESPG